MANASSDHHPNHVPGMLIIIKPKQPNLPICSATSINLLLHLFSKPSLHLIAKIILGIIMTAIIISPNIFNQSIYSSVNPDWSMSYYTINLPVFQSQSRNQLGKKRRRIFACGEDSHALRLASELADLRAVNANRRICGRRKCPAKPCHPSQNKGIRRMPLVLAGVAGFGPTSARVKVWCLTAWLHPNLWICTRIVYHKSVCVSRLFRSFFAFSHFLRRSD